MRRARTQAERTIEYLTDDRDPSTRDLLVLMAIQHNAHEGWLDEDELLGIVADIRQETLDRLPPWRRGEPYQADVPVGFIRRLTS